jgi:serine/threonine protein kinase
VKLVDFGVASTVKRLGSDSVPFVRGKVGYMAPEQTRADVLDRRDRLSHRHAVVCFILSTDRVGFLACVALAIAMSSRTRG